MLWRSGCYWCSDRVTAATFWAKVSPSARSSYISPVIIAGVRTHWYARLPTKCSEPFCLERGSLRRSVWKSRRVLLQLLSPKLTFCHRCLTNCKFHSQHLCTQRVTTFKTRQSNFHFRLQMFANHIITADATKETLLTHLLSLCASIRKEDTNVSINLY